MKRKLFVWAAILLALPIYWTADKLLQKLAVSIASEQVLAEAREQAFWVSMFNLKTPLMKQVVSFEEATSLDSNAVAWTISGDLGGTPFDHEVVLVLRAKSGKRTWLKYHLDLCGEEYCPFDKNKFLPTEEHSEEEMRVESIGSNVDINVLGFDLIVTYEVGITGTGKVRWSEIRILDSSRNPVDGFFRDLTGDGPPQFWQTAWQAPEDILLKTIPER